MRTLKKTLCLVLVLSMICSFGLIGANAAFKDQDEITYEEAVDVMTALGVVQGIGDNTFDPQGSFTRAQATKILAYMILGESGAESLPAQSNFSDVPAAFWASKYIGFGVQQGYIAGMGDGTFDPDGSLTGYQWAKMLLCALGYDAKIEQFVGTGWEINVAKVALGADVDLFEGNKGADYNAVATREEAVLYAFNTLTRDMIEYDDKGSTIVVGGVEISQGASKAKAVEIKNETQADNYSNTKDGLGYQQFCEKYFEKLAKTVLENGDDFGRPATTWRYNKSDIGTYADTADVTYTDEVKAKEIYSDLGLSKTVASEDVTVMCDGVTGSVIDISKNSSIVVPGTDTGVVTEVFYDEDEGTITIVEYNYYLVQATEDYDTKNEDVNVEVKSNITLSDAALSNDDFAVSGVQEDDYLVITATQTGSNGKYEVQSVTAAKIVENAVVSGARSGSYVVADGTRYNYNATAAAANSGALGQSLMASGSSYDINGDGYDLYLDPNGYVLGVESHDGTVNVGDYLFVKQSSTNGFDLIAKVVLMDGTTKTITVDKVDSKDENLSTSDITENSFYKFSTDKDGNYELTTIDNSVSSKAVYQGKEETASVTSAAQPISGLTIAGNASTVFIAKDKVYTGVKNAPKVSNTDVYYLVNDSGKLMVVLTLVKGSSVSGSDDELVYILKTNPTIEKDGDDTYYVYDAIVDGEKTELKSNNSSLNDVGLYLVTGYTDGRADLAVASKTASDAGYSELLSAFVSNVSTADYSDGVLTLDSDSYILADGVQIFTIDGTTVDTISASNVKSNVNDGYDDVTLIRTSSSNDDITVIYLSK